MSAPTTAAYVRGMDAPTIPLPSLAAVPTFYLSDWARTGELRPGEVHIVAAPVVSETEPTLEPGESTMTDGEQRAWWLGYNAGREDAQATDPEALDLLLKVNAILTDPDTPAEYVAEIRATMRSFSPEIDTAGTLLDGEKWLKALKARAYTDGVQSAVDQLAPAVGALLDVVDGEALADYLTGLREREAGGEGS